MAEFLQETLKPHFNFWIYVILMLIGLWSVIAKKNLIKKLIGLSIFQTAIILFYVSMGVKEGASIPIMEHHAEEHLAESPPQPPQAVAEPAVDAAKITNPVPHVLMLTAIVVGVATLGVALALCQMIFKEFGTLEEDELLLKIKALHDDD
ncbi:MAG: cation:proton antiporter subunit C [Verrucomicrobiales bacterium]|jgi:multicomponent Na+:H+ antiporter subunit C|nr:cation:proton antiporter subunit C [Verrucomicrobiales bacterium]MBP9224681.1 cation:proton antiporter subunit C [Verrucomicrobiales bacterium]HQZ29583.1 cation:proton antiporter subunit C [Verrucomicrobiales bacterium]